MSSTSTTRRSFGLVAAGALIAPAILSLRATPAEAQRRRSDPSKPAWDLIESAAPVSMFSNAVKTHGLVDEFKAAGAFGFFIPSNNAVERATAMQIQRFRTDREFARQIILNHITDFDDMINAFPGANTSAGAYDTVKTRAGFEYTLQTGASFPRLGGHGIVAMNYRVSNGYCHLLDGVLMI